MKIKFLLGVLAIGAVTALNSCKDDEVPVAGINFELAEQEVQESDGTVASFHPDEADDGVGRVIKAKLVFDIPLAGDVTLKFDVDGTARQTASADDNIDFEIDAEGDNLTVDGTNVTILKGSTEASFNVRVYEDFVMELTEDSEFNEDDIPYETVELQLESIVSGPGKLGEAIEHVVKILEDDAYVYLAWGVNNTDDPGDVNMDLLIYINGNFAGGSAYSTTASPYEIVTIPGGYPTRTFGLSYVYKAGTANDVDFLAEIFNFGGTLTTSGGTSNPLLQFNGSYTLQNINNYNSTTPSSNITQTMVKNGLNYTGVTALTIPATGSREGAKVSRESILRRMGSARPLIKTLR
ncbi:MAG TPA: hypothetical protein VGD65_17505 [Chryseosolibacter sp.]